MEKIRNGVTRGEMVDLLRDNYQGELRGKIFDFFA